MFLWVGGWVSGWVGMWVGGCDGTSKIWFLLAFNNVIIE